jgi:hypothetical protein
VLQFPVHSLLSFPSSQRIIVVGPLFCFLNYIRFAKSAGSDTCSGSMASNDMLYNGCSFVAGLFLLEWGADSFIDHTVIVAKRLGLSPTLVSLLTAGGEWEEVCLNSVSQESNGSDT